MKLALFSHCAIDTITIDGINHEQIGGAACYGGLTARQLKFDVDLYTKFGKDFPMQYLTQNKIDFKNAISEKPTTRFAIDITGSDRTLKLLNECDPIDYATIDADGSLITPIYHEISSETFSRIKKDSSFTLVDPQGFLRRVDLEKNVFLENTEESQKLVSGSHDEMMMALQKKGVQHVIFTNKTEVSLLVKDKIYSITLPNKEVYDTTGIGDIFCATFCCTMIKEKDFLWALCFAGGSAQAALESKQIGLLKIPHKSAIESNASYFYNLVKYRTI
jgi:sugar/nucleoside kinase (ribokinase family)